MSPGGLVIFLLFPLSSALCPPNFFYDDVFKKCYNYSSEAKNFYDAEIHCSKLYPDSHLASIKNEYENFFLSGVVRGESQVWIGFNSYAKGFWSWTSGEDSTFLPSTPTWTNLTVIKPECATLSSSRDWTRLSCYKTYPFLCAVEPTYTTTTPSTTSTSTIKPTTKPVQTTTKVSGLLMPLLLIVCSLVAAFQ